MTQNNEPIIVERTFNAPVQKVWEAISDKEKMKQWYFAVSDFKQEPGFEFTFAGQGSNGEKHLHLCKVIEVVPQKKLSYTWQYEGKEGSSLVTFDLIPQKDTCKIILTHSGVETFAANGADFAKSSFKEGWTMIIGTSLRDFAESK